MFLDLLEFRVENKKKYLEKNCFVICFQTCGTGADIVPKVTLKKKYFVKFRISMGKFWPLRTL